MKKLNVIVLSLVFVFLAGAACKEWERIYLWENPEIEGTILKERPSPKDDFAAYVNFDWYNSAKLPPDPPYTGADEEANERLEDRVLALITEQGAEAEDGGEAALHRGYYNQALDYARNFDTDVSPITDAIHQIMGANSLEEITALLKENNFLLQLVPFVDFGVIDDMREYKKNLCVIAYCTLLFNDSEYFFNGSKIAQKWLKEVSALMTDLLKSCGVKADAAKECACNFIFVQTEMARHKRPLADSAKKDYLESLYNIYSFEQLKDEFKNFPLADFVEAMGLKYNGKYQVCEPDFIKGLDALYVEENLQAIKGYLCCKCAQVLADFGNAEHQKILKKHDKKLGRYPSYFTQFYNKCSKIGAEKFALRRTISTFCTSLGRRYMAKYLPGELKEKIEDMTRTHIAIYRERLQNAEWLSEETRRLAIEKLDSMNVVVGQRENLLDITRFFSGMGRDWLGTAIATGNAMMNAVSDKLFAPYDEAWGEGMDALLVNAYNEFTSNTIYILAGILQSPFYEEGYSDEEILGGIGAIIGHEISHAFDAVGSQFDKHGNMAEWWTDEDKSAFSALNDAVEAYYGRFIVLKDYKTDGKKTDVTLDGERTVTENAADLGGLSCCLDQMNMLENPDYKKFFETYAKTWTAKGSADFFYGYIISNEHSMCYLRINAVVQQFQEFYDTYGVEEGDRMYLAPENRLKVW